MGRSLKNLQYNSSDENSTTMLSEIGTETTPIESSSESSNQLSRVFGFLNNTSATNTENERRNSSQNSQTGLSSSTSRPHSQMELSHPVTILEELEVASGRIEFDGRGDLNLRRKMWIMRVPANEYMRIKFSLEENNLGDNGYVTVWKEGGGFGQEEYSGSQRNWSGEKEFDWADMFVVVLTMRKSGGSAAASPSFKLRYEVIRDDIAWNRSTETMTKNGLQFFSYPPKNEEEYPLRSVFTGVIAPENGNPFNLTLKYLDIPRTPPQCGQSYFHLSLLKEDPTETKFERQTFPAFSLCGRKGNVSELIGTSTVALIKFNPVGYASETGRGFRLEVDTSN